MLSSWVFYKAKKRCILCPASPVETQYQGTRGGRRTQKKGWRTQKKQRIHACSPLVLTYHSLFHTFSYLLFLYGEISSIKM
jgi:hypothetical protein